MMRALILAAAVLALASCGEKPQTLSSGVKLDAPAYTGPASPFTAAGWTPGDKTSWEQELKTRTENGQNEYNRIK